MLSLIPASIFPIITSTKMTMGMVWVRITIIRANFLITWIFLHPIELRVQFASEKTIFITSFCR